MTDLPAPKNSPLLRVKSIDTSSSAAAADFRRGDTIVAVNGTAIADELDFAFHTAQEHLSVAIVRRGKRRTLTLEREPGTTLGLDFHAQPIHRCNNRCVFCFIDQMPRGLRSGLYVKDEDFTHSFLNGNYVTLSAATRADLDKAVSIGLSPLFISVHSTDRNVRNALLRNRKAPDILEQLRYLSARGVSFHTQIVLCPGYNDDRVLEKTIEDLFAFGESLLSIAVVPVGLTSHRKEPLRPVDTSCALAVCAQVDALSQAHAARDGVRKLFCADEFFVRAGCPVPTRNYYEDYPQIENGVGLVRQLMEQWRAVKRNLKKSAPSVFTSNKIRAFLVATSTSAFPYINSISREIQSLLPGLEFRVIAVENRFFGSSVTVAGLLCAADIVRSVQRTAVSPAPLILPSVMFNYAGFTLDGYSRERLARRLGRKVIIVESLIEMIEATSND